MTEVEQLKHALIEAVGEDGCGGSCENAEIYQDDEGWKLQLSAFWGPWELGQTMDEAKQTMNELASKGFGICYR